jgi:O-antigen/teichoic acid export membrane protein
MYIEASLFMAAQQTSVLTAFIFLATDKVFSPQIAVLFTLKKDYEAKKLIIFTARMMLLFSLPLLFMLIIFSSQVLMLFGHEYMAAKFALIFLTFAQFSRVLSGNSYSILAMQGLKIKLSNISLTVLPISIILNIILINFYGLNGAALSTGITIFIYHYLCFYAARKSLGYYPFFLSK